MKLPTFLRLSKQNVYVFRRRIPADVTQHFNTDEIRFSLRTANIRDAVASARILAAQADLLFYQLRHNMATDNDNKLMQILRQKKIDIFRSDQNERLSDLLADKQSEIIALKRQHEREMSLVLASKGSTGPHTTEAPPLSVLINEFLSPEFIARRADKLSTARKDKDALTLFLKIVGDRPIDTINQADALKFSKEIRTFEARGKERAPNTANNMMSSISKFSEWVTAYQPEAGHTKLEFRGLRYPKTTKPSDERGMVELEEIRKIFSHPELHKQRRFDPSRFWMLHIALYSGLRVEEIAQLDPATDIIEDEDGILVFDINARGTKSLKTPSAARQVPIHSALLKLGLLEYIKSIKTGSKSIFTDSTERDGRLGKAIGKRTNYFIRNSTGVNKTLHSFRHTFSTLLKRAKVEENITAALLGHAHGGITYSRYGKSYELKMLRDVMEKHIKFDIAPYQKSEASETEPNS